MLNLINVTPTKHLIRIVSDISYRIWAFVPSQTCYDYVNKLVKHLENKDETLFISIYHLLRLRSKVDLNLVTFDWQLVLSSCIFLAYKYIIDWNIPINGWAQISKVVPSHLKMIERILWTALDYRLHVTKEGFISIRDAIRCRGDPVLNTFLNKIHLTMGLRVQVTT